MAAVAKTVAAVVTPCTPLLALKINPAPRKPIPVITACKALVGSAVLAFSPTTSPIVQLNQSIDFRNSILSLTAEIGPAPTAGA